MTPVASPGNADRPQDRPVEMCDDCGEVKVVTVYERGPGQAHRQVLCRDCGPQQSAEVDRA